MSIVGNMFFPGLLDRYVAKTWEGQLTDEAEPTQRPDYLFQPLENGHQAHGRFDSHAKNKAIAVDSRVMGVAAVAVAGLLVKALFRRR